MNVTYLSRLSKRFVVLSNTKLQKSRMSLFLPLQLGAFVRTHCKGGKSTHKKKVKLKNEKIKKIKSKKERADLNSSLIPYARVISGISSITAAAAAFIRPSALPSFGFSNSYLFDNLPRQKRTQPSESSWKKNNRGISFGAYSCFSRWGLTY